MEKQAPTGHFARILTRFWRHALVVSILTCSVPAVGWAQVSIDGAFSPPDAADTTAHMQQTRSLKQDYSSTPIALRITLPEVTDTEHAAWEGRERTVPLQIGFGREIPAAWQDDLAPRAGVDHADRWDAGQRAQRHIPRSPGPAGGRLCYLRPRSRTALLRSGRPRSTL